MVDMMDGIMAAPGTKYETSEEGVQCLTKHHQKLYK